MPGMALRKASLSLRALTAKGRVVGKAEAAQQANDLRRDLNANAKRFAENDADGVPWAPRTSGEVS